MFHHDSKTVSVERSNLSEAWRFNMVPPGVELAPLAGWSGSMPQMQVVFQSGRSGGVTFERCS